MLGKTLLLLVLVVTTARADDECVVLDDASAYQFFDAGYDTIDAADDWYFDYYDLDRAIGAEDLRTAGALRRLQGHIVGEKLVQVRGTNQHHMIAMVRTPRGGEMPVDLGPYAHVQHLGVGDSLTIDGYPVGVRGRLVLVGTRAHGPDRLTVIDRAVMRDRVERSGRVDVACDATPTVARRR
jgi:hypothetical protein